MGEGTGERQSRPKRNIATEVLLTGAMASSCQKDAATRQAPRNRSRSLRDRGNRALRCLIALTGAAATLLCVDATAQVAAATAQAAAAAPPTPSRNVAARAPLCANGNERRSMALAGGELTVSPEPGTLDATPTTQISLLGVPAKRIFDVSVVGSRTGAHAGALKAYSQRDGASFVPGRPFAEGERVTVKLVLRSGKRTRHVGWRFTIDSPGGLGSADYKFPHKTGHAPPAQHFRSRPDLLPPTVEVTTRNPKRRPGFLLMAPYSIEPGQAGPMILDDSGNVVWFHPVNVGAEAATKATNFEVQRYGGQPVLTWWEDPLVDNGGGRREPQDVIYDKSYERIATISGGNGLVPDVHEMSLTPDGTALIAIKHDIRCDLASVHGRPNGSIWDGAIQEIDVKTGLVRWEWNSLDHVSMKEAYDSARVASATYPFDFFHLNSIQAIDGKSLLISARNTWAMYDVDRRTGLIRWRLGGKRSSFQMGPGTRTAWQHDAGLVRFLGPHELELSVFDNGSTPKEHPQSRALFERVDLKDRTARLIHAYTNDPPLLAGSQGSVETGAEGSIVVGWGQEPWVTEYDSAGKIVFDAHLPSIEQSYRALRFEWTGTPTEPPQIAVEPAQPGTLSVYASWNGATEVASWRILEGTASTSMAAVAEAPKAGFETRISAPASAPLVEVQALNAAGEPIGTSQPAQTGA